MSNLYATDGKCHNAEKGTFGHECGKPAQWVGFTDRGWGACYCDDCKQNGYEAGQKVRWERFVPKAAA